MSSPRRFIARATRRKGALHRHLGIPPGDTIPLARLRHAAKHGETETIRREARLALLLRGFQKKKGRRRRRS